MVLSSQVTKNDRTLTRLLLLQSYEKRNNLECKKNGKKHDQLEIRDRKFS